MQNLNARKGMASSVPAGIAWGVGSGLVLVFAGSASFAKLLDMEKLRWEMIGYWIMGMLMLASFAGAAVACRKIKRKRLQMSLLSGCVLWLVLIGMTALFFGGQYDGVGVTGALLLAGSVSAGLLGSRPQKGRKGMKYQI